MMHIIYRTIGIGCAACLLILGWGANGMTQERTDDIIRDETGTYYVVKPGDTLWDISRRLLNSPYYWPDLWQVNSKSVPITNPHLIYPGQRLRLVLRSDRQMPAAPPAPAPLPAAAPAMRPPAPEPAPGPPPPTFLYTSIDQVGFIRKEPVTPNGVIIKVRGDKEMISSGDIVYIDETEGQPVQAGSQYYVFRTSDPMTEAETQAFLGTQHLLTGVVEVTQIEAGLAIGDIKKAFRDIRLGDKLMPFAPRSPNIPLSQTPEGLTGKLIISENRTTMMGEHDIAFIDKGAADGVQVGQSYSLFSQDAARVNLENENVAMLTPFDIGKILVLHIEENTATVLIIRSKVSISPGDRFRSMVNP